jgi:hypothetical protein
VPYKDPERQRAAKAEHARRSRRGTPRGTLGPLVSGDERLATARDILERARTVATLCGLALRAIESGDLAGRLEALERHLSGRAT